METTKTWISITTKRPDYGSKVTVRWNDNTETDNIWTGFDPNEEILPVAWKYREPESVPSCGEQEDEKEKAHYWYYLGAAEGLTHSLAGKKPEFEKAWSRFNENQFQEWTGERTPDNVIDFLMGSGSLCGVWYGDPKPDHEKGNYWWRKHLRKYLESERLKARNEAIQECIDIYKMNEWYDTILEKFEKLKSKTI